MNKQTTPDPVAKIEATRCGDQHGWVRNGLVTGLLDHYECGAASTEYSLKVKVCTISVLYW